jgi:hypothetical protein
MYVFYIKLLHAAQKVLQIVSIKDYAFHVARIIVDILLIELY